jgi:triacylglycerol lipase
MIRPLLFLAGLFLGVSAMQAGVTEAPARNPVLLVHGINNTARSMEPLAKALRGQGWNVQSMTYKPNRGQKGLEMLAAQVDQYVKQNYPPGQKIDLVGYSMGGLVTRYYLQRLGGLDRVERYITVSAPHNGTLLAYLVPNPGGRQMRFHSSFLRDLESDADRLRQVDFTSLHTPLDLVIVPAKSSIIPQARNETVWVGLHPLMIRQPQAQRAIAAALSRPEQRVAIATARPARSER